MPYINAFEVRKFRQCNITIQDVMKTVSAA